MHFKWDSNVARDIAVEMDRLEQGISDCIVELDHCAGILEQMQGGDMSQAIEKYVGAAKQLTKNLRGLGEETRRTGRAIERADELFEGLEAEIKGRATGMGGREANPEPFPTRQAAVPLFYNTRVTVDPRAMIMLGPRGGQRRQAPPVWPVLRTIERSVIIDQITIRPGMVTPQWLLGIIGGR